jgi:hypothetical protein
VPDSSDSSLNKVQIMTATVTETLAQWLFCLMDKHTLHGDDIAEIEVQIPQRGPA